MRRAPGLRRARRIGAALCFHLVACSPADESSPAEAAVLEVAGLPDAAFDGAPYVTDEAMLRHGERVSSVLGCNNCHLADYSGTDFGAIVPIVEGLWATNLTRSLPTLTDEQLEHLLRTGEHPTREIYLMPSKNSQFLGARDMAALIAHLRTIEPTGDPSPVPPPGFEAAVTERLPENYWRTTPGGEIRSYHNAAEEASYFAENAPPVIPGTPEQGRLVALTVCTACHGAALDGVGEDAGGIEAAAGYDDDAFVRLLRQGVDRDGRPLAFPWGPLHVPEELTDGELAAVISYSRALANRRITAGGG